MLVSSNIEKKIINNGNDRFIQLTLKNEQIQEFEIGFLNSVEEEGLLGVEKNIFDNEINLKYCITGLVSLEEYFKATQNTKENMLMIFSSISEIISKCSFLTSNKFIIESDMVFIEAETLKVKLIYLPIVDEYTKNISENFTRMLDGISSKILIDGNVKEGSGDFIVAIKRKTQEENLTISDLIEFAKKQCKIESKTNKNINKPVIENRMASQALGQSNVASVKKDIAREKQNNTSKKVTDKPNNLSVNNNIKTKAEVVNKNIKVQEPKVTEILRYKTSRIVGTILIQPIFIGIVLALFLIDGITTVQLAGAAVLMLALDAIIVRNLLDPKKKEKVKVSVATNTNKSNNNIKNTKANNEVKNTVKPEVNKPVVEKKPVINEATMKKPVVFEEETSIIFDEETTIIDDAQNFEEETTLIAMQAYLEVDNGSKTGREDIISDNYIIGRNAALRTWISASGVSREHAVIVNMGANYVIKDLNSKNGTKVNGNKLVGNEEIALNDGDVIEIPGLTMTFRL